MFPCTNNITNYEALVTGIKVVVEWKITELQVYGDSQLVINQVNGDYQAKDDKMMLYKIMVDDFKKDFVDIKFEQILRMDNKVADAMATIASLIQIPPKKNRYEILVEQLFFPAHDNPESQVICHLVHSDSPLYEKIFAYQKDNTLPSDLSRNQKCKFIRQATLYTLTVDTLYR